MDQATIDALEARGFRFDNCDDGYALEGDTRIVVIPDDDSNGVWIIAEHGDDSDDWKSLLVVGGTDAVLHGIELLSGRV